MTANLFGNVKKSKKVGVGKINITKGKSLKSYLSQVSVKPLRKI